MKTIKLFSIVLMLVLLFSTNLLAQSKYDINVVMIGIGEKNPTWDEKVFPNLSFYYTPELVSQAEVGETAKSALAMVGGSTREVFEGKPELLAKWWDDRDLRNYALVFDKNGVGVWQGKIKVGYDIVEDSEGKGEESNLEDVFEFLIEDGKVMEFDDGKEFDFEDVDCIIETKIPDFEVVALDGSKISFQSLTKGEKPTMVVFFQISKDVNINAAEENKNNENVGEYFGAVAQSMAGKTWHELMQDLEYYIFENEVEVKMLGDK